MEFTIWKNKYKDKENQPDYLINQKDETGKWVEIGAAWKKTVKGKVDEKGQPVTYLSCKLKKGLSDEEKRQLAIIKNAEAIKKEVVESGEIDVNLIPF